MHQPIDIMLEYPEYNVNIILMYIQMNVHCEKEEHVGGY